MDHQVSSASLQSENRLQGNHESENYLTSHPESPLLITQLRADAPVFESNGVCREVYFSKDPCIQNYPAYEDSNNHEGFREHEYFAEIPNCGLLHMDNKLALPVRFPSPSRTIELEHYAQEARYQQREQEFSRFGSTRDIQVFSSHLKCYKY